MLVLEWFSVECRKTKTKVITLASQKEHTQYSVPIKTRNNYMWLTQSAGKRVRVYHDWFWLYFWVDEKLARVFLTQSRSVEFAKPITFWHSSENRSISIVNSNNNNDRLKKKKLHACTIAQFRYIKIVTWLRGLGGQKKLIIHPSSSMRFLVF